MKKHSRSIVAFLLLGLISEALLAQQQHQSYGRITTPKWPDLSLVVDSWLYAVDNGRSDDSSTLLRLGTTANDGIVDLEVIGETGFEDIFDIAFAGGRLYGITSDDLLVEIDLSTGVGILVGDMGSISGTPNALGPRDDDSVIAATTSGAVYHVSVVDATATEVGTFGSGQDSAGDLARDSAGTVFGVDGLFSEINILLNVHPNTGFANPIGSLGFGSVWGLAVDPMTDVLYCVVDADSAPKLATVEKSTGMTTIIGSIPTTNPVTGFAAAPIAANTLNGISGLIVPGFFADALDPMGPGTLFAVRNQTDGTMKVEFSYYGLSIEGGPLRTDIFGLAARQTLTQDVRNNLTNLEIVDGVARGLIVVNQEGGGAADIEGDYFQVDFTNNFAAGDRLARTSDLCTRQEIRFVDFGSGSELRVLLDDPPAGGIPAFTWTAYDEAGQLLDQGSFFSTNNLELLDFADLIPQPFGTLVMDFSNSNVGWASAKYSAFGRFSVELNGACID